jgi:hypothetical protein
LAKKVKLGWKGFLLFYLVKTFYISCFQTKWNLVPEALIKKKLKQRKREVNQREAHIKGVKKIRIEQECVFDSNRRKNVAYLN